MLQCMIRRMYVKTEAPGSNLGFASFFSFFFKHLTVHLRYIIQLSHALYQVYQIFSLGRLPLAPSVQSTAQLSARIYLSPYFWAAHNQIQCPERSHQLETSIALGKVFHHPSQNWLHARLSWFKVFPLKAIMNLEQGIKTFLRFFPAQGFCSCSSAR